MAVCTACGGSGIHHLPNLIPPGVSCAACHGAGVRPDTAVGPPVKGRGSLVTKRRKLIESIRELDDDIDFHRDAWVLDLERVDLFEGSASRQLQRLKDQVESINPYRAAVTGDAATRNITAGLMELKLKNISFELSSLVTDLEAYQRSTRP